MPFKLLSLTIVDKFVFKIINAKNRIFRWFPVRSINKFYPISIFGLSEGKANLAHEYGQ